MGRNVREMDPTIVVVGIDKDEVTKEELKTLRRKATKRSMVEWFPCGYEDNDFGPKSIYGIGIVSTWNDALRLDDLITERLVNAARKKLVKLLGPDSVERTHLWVIGHQT